MLGRVHGSDEIFDCSMVFHTGCTLNTAANVHRMRRHRRDRFANIFGVQTAGENQEWRVALCGLRSGPIARLTCATPQFGVVRIDEYIAFWERCCVFRLELRIG